ncbi:MAG: MFS transporter, partial [Coleofasciculaceae cyanobacterium SM2_1_6]|nr:MFS transporter [Coleofasciculaceae cyanobacterium SM2_1_6]
MTTNSSHQANLRNYILVTAAYWGLRSPMVPAHVGAALFHTIGYTPR